MNESILIVDDDANTLEVISRNLAGEGYRVYAASAVDEAVRTLGAAKVDLVVTDYKMPGASGLDLVRHVRENLRDTEIVMITGYPTVEGAVQAVKSGAEEYVAKPFTVEELLGAVHRALEKLQRRRAVSAAPALKPRDLLGSSEPMKRVFAEIAKAAAATATVLLTGESGTGKELVARAIHYGGPRAHAPFVAVNCGGVPEGLLESELFGHTRGAFTGAVDERRGFFEVANGGTILLDEIGDTSPAMQSKLMRVLQEREVISVGATRPRVVDVRVIAATNQDLAALVRRKAFREDLFFRLNVVPIAMPPLRARGDDVLVLASQFAARFARELGRRAPIFSDAALQAMRDYYWPGNVRELENIVQRVVVMSDVETVEVPDLPPLLRYSAASGGPLRPLEAVETEHIRLVLASVGGNKSKAAEILRIDRKTLREKLKRAGLDAG